VRVAPIVALAVGTVVVLSAGCLPSIVGSWPSVRSETEQLDIVIEDGVERVVNETVVAFADAHALTFLDGGDGNVTTRAIFNVVSLEYLPLQTPTDTPLTWSFAGTDIVIDTFDGIAGTWSVTDDGVSPLLVRQVVSELGDNQRVARTTRLLLGN
jgi:hypothetical protein